MIDEAKLQRPADVLENLLRMSGGKDAAAAYHDYPFNKSERKVEVMHHNDAELVSPTPNQTPQTQGRRQPRLVCLAGSK
jgi:hypothetical protein